MIVYDTLLSFSQEIRSIWQRRIGAVSILYVVIRYVTLVGMTVKLFNASYVFRTVPVSMYSLVLWASIDSMALLEVPILSLAKSTANNVI